MKNYQYIIIAIFLILTKIVVAQKSGEGFTAFAYFPDRAEDSLYINFRNSLDWNEKIKILDAIASTHVKLGTTDSILYYGELLQESVIEKYNSITNPKLYTSKAFDYIGKAKRMQGLYEEALKYHLEGIVIETEIEPKYYKYWHVLGLGLVYYYKKEYDTALNYFEDCIKKSGDKKIEAIALKSSADIYFNKDQMTLVEKTYKKALNIAIEEDLTRLELQIKVNLGQMLGRQGKYEEAITYFEEIKVKAFQNKFYDIYMSSMMYIGLAYQDLGEYEAAEMVLLTARTNAMQWGRRDIERNIIKNLRDIKVAQGDFKNAYALMTQYQTISNSIVNDQNKKEIKKLEVAYQTKQKEEEIKTQKTFKNAILIGFLIILIPIIALLFVYYQKLQAQSELNVKEKEISQQKISGLIKEQELEIVKASAKAQNKERGRIAKELHDSIGGNLAGIKLQLANLYGEEKFSRTIIDQIDDTYRQVREISHDLTPKKFNENAFTTLISNYIRQITEASQLSIEFTSHPEKKINALPDDIKVELYKITQELMTNILKHAQANHLEIHLTIYENQLQLLVEDDGVGFDMDSKESGIGLQNIKERVHQLKGELQIDSVVDRGTVVVILIPLS